MSQEIKEKAYFEEISKYIKKITGYNLTLSATDRQILQQCINKGISIKSLKTLIKNEVIKYPENKRKKINLRFLEKYLKKKKKTIEKSNITPQINKEKWANLVKELNLPEEILENEDVPAELYDFAIEAKIINFLWQNMPLEEKEEMKIKAIEKMKKEFILTNIDKKKVLKSLIRDMIKEKYNIK